MAQFEFQAEAEMLKPRDNYPSVLARLRLLAHFVDYYVPDKSALILQNYVIMFNQPNENINEVKIIPSIVRAGCQSFPNKLDDINNLLDFQTNEYEANGRVEKYADQLLANTRPETNKRLNTTRYYATGAAQACSKAIYDTNSDLERLNENLNECLGDIVNSAPDGT